MRKPLLCRFGLHRWRFGGALLTGCGARETCSRCGLSRDLMFGGAYVYFGPLPPEAKAHMDRSFEKLDESFGELNKAFDALRKDRPT